MPTVEHHPPAPESLLAHHEWARALAYCLVRDPHAAEDLAQDAMIAALENPPERSGALRGWLATVMRRRASNARRSATRRAAREQGRGERSHRPRQPDDVAAEAEAQRRVVEAVLALDTSYRDIVLMRFYDDEPLPEIATSLGVPYETARARLRRALGKLRARLDREHGGAAAWALPLIGDVTGGTSRTGLATGAVAVVVALLAGGMLIASALAPRDDVGGAQDAGSVAVLDDVAGGVAAESLPTGAPDDRSAEIAAPASRSRARVAVAPADGGTTRPDEPSSPTAATEDDPQPPPLPPTRTVRGVVQTPDGTTISEATVSVQPWAPDTGGWVKTGAAGRFEVTVPDGGMLDEYRVVRQWSVSFSARGFVRQRIPPWELTGDDVTVVLQPRPDTELTVRVTDASGDPMVGADVMVRRARGRPGERTQDGVTDARGEMRLRGVFATGTEVEALLLGTERVLVMTSGVMGDDGAVLELRLPSVRPLRIDLVWDGPAHAVSHLELEPRAFLHDRIEWPGGVFAEVELPATARRARAVSFAGAGPWVGIRDDADGLRLTIPSRKTTSVVLDPGAVPVKSVRLQVTLWAGDSVANVSLALAELRDDEGRFVLPVAPDAVALVWWTDEGVRHEWMITERTASPARLSDPQPREGVRVLVRSADGAPVAGATVRAVPDRIGSRVERKALTDDTGAAELSLAAGVKHIVRVEAAGTDGGAAEVVPGVEGELRISLGRAAARRVRIPGLDGGKAMSGRMTPGGAPTNTAVDGDDVVFDASGRDWTMLMTELGMWLVAPGGGEDATVDLGVVVGVPVEVRAGGRFALIGLDEVAPGYYPVAANGSPKVLPPGRYVPIDTIDGAVTVYPVVTLAGTEAVVVEPPDAATLEWREGKTVDGALDVVLVRVIDDMGAEVEVPVGLLAPGGANRWRSAGPDVRLVSVRPR